MLVAGAVALAVAIGAGSSAFRLIGTSFPGFLILENRVVASAGLAAWEGTRGGAIFQHEVVAVDGLPLGDARELAAIAADRGPGAPIRYELRRTALPLRTIATRRFGSGDSSSSSAPISSAGSGSPAPPC